MENNQQEIPEIKQPAVQMQIMPEAVSLLSTLAKWTKFLSILGFIMVGFLIMAGSVVSVFFGIYRGQFGDTDLMNYFSAGYMGFIYIVISIISLLPVIYLNNFSNATTRAVNSGSTERLTFAIRNLKRFFKFLGWLTIVMLTIYLVIVVSTVGAGIFMLRS